MNFVELHPIPIKERASLLFIERAQIDVEDRRECHFVDGFALVRIVPKAEE